VIFTEFSNSADAYAAQYGKSFQIVCIVESDGCSGKLAEGPSARQNIPALPT
jgi:hypothetical protein